MKKSIDYALLVVVIAIALFGAYMILSATFYSNIFDESNNPLLSFVSNFKKIGLGLIVMVIAIFFDARLVKKLSPFLMLTAIGFLVMTLIVGDTLNGGSRWITVGPISFAPTELAKIASILYFAKILEKLNRSDEDYQRGWVIVLFFGGLSAALIVFQNDLSSAFIYCVILGAMLLVAGAKFRHLGVILIIGVMLVTTLIMSSDFRMDRLASLKADDTDLLGNEAQANQSLLAIASGEVFGVGAGHAYQTKYGHSQSESDFIFATVAETTGFLGSVLLIAAYTFMLWRLVRIAVLSESLYAALVTTGIMTMIGFQAAVHLLVTTKIMPVTGVPLPLISSGGTSTIILLGSIGIALNLSSNPKGV